MRGIGTVVSPLESPLKVPLEDDCFTNWPFWSAIAVHLQIELPIACYTVTAASRHYVDVAQHQRVVRLKRHTFPVIINRCWIVKLACRVVSDIILYSTKFPLRERPAPSPSRMRPAFFARNWHGTPPVQEQKVKISLFSLFRTGNGVVPDIQEAHSEGAPHNQSTVARKLVLHTWQVNETSLAVDCLHSTVTSW